MLRHTQLVATRALVVPVLPLAAAAVFGGTASADAGRAVREPAPMVTTPVSGGIPLEVATDPDAQYPDPVLNGAAAGAAIGSATGSFIDPVFTLLGAGVGAVVGATNPGIVPQVLP